MLSFKVLPILLLYEEVGERERENTKEKDRQVLQSPTNLSLSLFTVALYWDLFFMQAISTSFQHICSFSTMKVSTISSKTISFSVLKDAIIGEYQ